jgi:hypothetical protein
MRLKLHRSHDGTSTVEDLAADLAAAREVTEAVDRVLAERGKTGREAESGQVSDGRRNAVTR